MSSLTLSPIIQFRTIDLIGKKWFNNLNELPYILDTKKKPLHRKSGRVCRYGNMKNLDLGTRWK